VNGTDDKRGVTPEMYLEATAVRDAEIAKLRAAYDEAKGSLARLHAYTTAIEGERDELVRRCADGERERDDALAKLKELGALQGHNTPCYYCKTPCNAVAGSPSLWPIPLCHKDDPGKVKWHHIGCVMKRLTERDAWLAAAFEIACDSPELLVERLKSLVTERNDLNDKLAKSREEVRLLERDPRFD
jgi:hypothetical protein